MVLAFGCELVQLGEMFVVQAGCLDELIGNRLFSGAAGGIAAQGQVLGADLALECFAIGGKRVVVRNDQPGNDGFAQPPGRLDHALVLA